MASFFSHPAFPVALYFARAKKVSKRLFITSCFLTLFPDADVIAFKFGIAYSSQWGHRGFTHSFTFALFLALLLMLFSNFFRGSKKQVFWWTFLSLLSHSFFDALTNGGLGVAFFWPMTNERYFLPWQVVEVSPIGVKGFLSLRGLKVVMNEIVWIWMPSLLLAICYKFYRKISKHD